MERRVVILGIPVSSRQILLVLGDVFALLAAAYIGHFIRLGLLSSQTMPFLDIVEQTTGATVFFVVVHLVFLYLADGYNPRQDFRAVRLMLRMWAALVAAFLALMALSYAAPNWAWGRGVALGSFLAFAVLAGLWRLVFAHLGLHPRNLRRLGLVGAPADIEKAVELVKRVPDLSDTYEVFDDNGSPLFAYPIEGLEHHVAEIELHRVRQLVVIAPPPLPANSYESLVALKARGSKIADVGTFISTSIGRLPIHHMDFGDMLYGPGFDEPSPFVKQLARAIDVVLATVGLLVTSPLLAVGMILVRLTSKGPIFYSQERIGQYEVPYRIFKLRTMYVDAEARTGPVWSKGAADPRVTPAGRFLRRSRIDELPQFFNVIRGDMSLVGPRPEREPFVSQLKEAIPFYGLRFAVKPGITGWAQVSYGYGANTEDARVKLEYELYSIRNMNPVLYLLILLKTVQTVLVRAGS